MTEYEPFEEVSEEPEAVSLEPEEEPAEPTLTQEKPEEVFRPFVLLHSPTRKQALIAAFALILLIIFDHYTVFAHLSTHVYGGSTRDGGLYLWLFGQNQHFFSYPWFDTQAFYPYGMTLAWSDNFLLPAFFGAILGLLGISSLSAYNSILLGALFLNGYCTYQLAHRITGAFVASVIAGIGFCSYAFFTHQAGHPQLLFAFWIPLGVLFTCIYIATLRKRWLLLAFSCVTGSFLCSVYYSIFLALLIPTFLFGIYLVRPNYFGRRQLTDSVVSAVAIALPTIPFVLPYLRTQQLFGNRNLYEPFYFSATGLSYATATISNVLYGSILSGLSHAEATLFPGFTLFVFFVAALRRLGVAKKLRRLGQGTLLSLFATLCLTDAGKTIPILLYLSTIFAWLTLLLAAWFLRALGTLERSREYYVLSNRNYIGVFLFCCLVFTILSLGPIANSGVGQFPFSPFAALFITTPGVGAIRASGRFGMVAVWCIFMVLPFLLPLIRRKKKWGTRFYALTAFLLLLENFCSTYPLEEIAHRPFAYDALQRVSDTNHAVIALPVSPKGIPGRSDFEIDSYASHTVNTMLWTQGSYLKLVNGYSGQLSAMHKKLAADLIGFPDSRSLTALGGVTNLNHVIVHGDKIPGFDPAVFTAAIAASPGLSILEENPPVYLLSYLPETRISKSFSLYVPSHETGTLNLELKALYQENSPDISVHMFIGSLYEDAPFVTFPVSANDTYDVFSVRLPDSPQGMRPLRIYFSSDAPGQIYLRKREFLPGDA